MSDLTPWQAVFVGLIFTWGAFARSGLGFGGAALTLPLLLLIVDSPLEVLPLIAVHLVIFGLAALHGRWHRVDWAYLRRALPFLLPGKVIGVLGLLSLPGQWLSVIVYAVTAVYATMYLMGWEFRSRSAWADASLLGLGGYVSGTSLIGAPLIASVFVRHVSKESLRETLFVLWIGLVSLKLSAFVVTGTDLQWQHHLWLLPCALLGHVLGLRLHRRLLALDQKAFLRWIGAALLLITAVGSVHLLWV